MGIKQEKDNTYPKKNKKIKMRILIFKIILHINPYKKPVHRFHWLILHFLKAFLFYHFCLSQSPWSPSKHPPIPPPQRYQSPTKKFLKRNDENKITYKNNNYLRCVEVFVYVVCEPFESIKNKKIMRDETALPIIERRDKPPVSSIPLQNPTYKKEIN